MCIYSTVVNSFLCSLNIEIFRWFSNTKCLVAFRGIELLLLHIDALNFLPMDNHFIQSLFITID